MRSLLSAALLTLALCGFASHLHAADITFAAPQFLNNPAADVILAGPNYRAYAFSQASTFDVNGVTFKPLAANPFGDTTSLATSFQRAPDGQVHPFGTLLDFGLSQDLTPSTMTFNGLIPGAAYTIEVFAAGLRARSDCCQAGAGYTNNRVSGDTSSGTGSIEWSELDGTSRAIYGTFTASPSGSQTVNFNLHNTGGVPANSLSANIHGVVLSTSVPEPASLMLMSLAGTMMLSVRRQRGN